MHIPPLVRVDLPRIGVVALVSPLVVAHRIDEPVHVDSRDTDPWAEEPVSGWIATIAALSPYVEDAGRLTWRAHLDEMWIADGAGEVWLIAADQMVADDVPASIETGAEAWEVMQLAYLRQLGFPRAKIDELMPAHVAALGWLERLYPTEPGD